MPRKRRPLDADDIVNRYLAGQSAANIASAYICRQPAISAILKEHGVRVGAAPLDMSAIAARYEAGESAKSIADDIGSNHRRIIESLRRHGVPTRSQSEAERQKWSALSKDERTERMAKSHEAIRGRPVPLRRKLKTAQTKQAKGQFDSRDEERLHAMLLNRGVVNTPQLAVGPYNCDLGAEPVAVEVFGGHWHWTGRHYTRLGKRVDHLFDRAFHVLIVQTSSGHPLTDAMGDYVAAYIQSARMNPTAWREYRVVRGAGQTIAVARSDSDDRTLVPTFRVTRSALGQYVSVPD